MARVINLEIIGHPVNLMTIFFMIVIVWLVFYFVHSRSSMADDNSGMN